MRNRLVNIDRNEKTFMCVVNVFLGDREFTIKVPLLGERVIQRQLAHPRFASFCLLLTLPFSTTTDPYATDLVNWLRR